MSGTDHVCVLTDGGLEPGLGALINSLIRNGFDGTLWIGWRGGPPELLDRGRERVGAQITIQLVEINSSRPLANYKADFIESVWQLAGSAASSVSYMDCDIVLGCDWAFIRAWVSGGLAVVEDLPHRPVGSNHPLRRAWKSFMASAGVPPARELSEYYNSGFVGVPADCRMILPVWSRLCRLLEGLPGIRLPGSEPHTIRGVRVDESPLEIAEDVVAVMRPYLLEDQDALNMSVMGSDVPLCPMGPDAMGFTTARTPIVPHAIGPDKPWTKHYVRRLIGRGEGPTFADDLWWRYSDHPIPVANGSSYVLRRWSWRAAKVLDRVL